MSVDGRVEASDAVNTLVGQVTTVPFGINAYSARGRSAHTATVRNKGTIMTQELTKQERKDLLANEKIIENGMRSFIDVGQALGDIRNRKLWRHGYDSFKGYLGERWGFGPSYASRLISGSEVATRLPEVVNEGQARELSRVPYTDQVKVLDRAKTNAISANRTLTAEDIRIAAREPSVMTAREITEDGNWDEKELSTLWSLADTTIKDLKQLTRRLSLHPEGCWIQPHAETLESRIKDVERILGSAKPHAPCPMCCGGMMKGCDACRDRGWLPKERHTVAANVKKQQEAVN